MYRNSKKTGIKILAALCILAVLLGISCILLEKHTVQTVYVEGNVHYTEEEIKALVMSGPMGDNSLYLSVKYRNKAIEGIPFVDEMHVSILSPDTIKISVYEKALVGYVKYLDTYMYFDKDGYVVESSSIRTVGIPQVVGLTFDYVILGEPLPVENPEVFSSILDITKLINKYELVADRIYFQQSGDISVYFGEIRVALGQESERMEDKVLLLADFLEKLSGKSGTLHMESYDEDGGKYTFKPE